MLIQTFNLQGKPVTTVAKHLSKDADFFCFQEVSQTFISQLQDGGANKLAGTMKVNRQDCYSVVAYPHHTKPLAIAGKKSFTTESMIMHADKDFPDVIRPAVGLKYNNIRVLSVHAPSGKEDCAKLEILRWVRDLQREEGQWYLAGDMNIEPVTLGKYYHVKEFFDEDYSQVNESGNQESGVYVICVQQTTQVHGRTLDFLITNDSSAVVKSIGTGYVSDHLPVTFSCGEAAPMDVS